jgi:hypothetical protein
MGVAGWSDLAVDFDVCEMCFMSRSARDPWEVPFVDTLEVEGSSSAAEYVHLQVTVYPLHTPFDPMPSAPCTQLPCLACGAYGAPT